MSKALLPGIRLTINKVVGKDDTAAVCGSGSHSVLSTPAMIALMEMTAMKSVEACLDNDEGTVGTEVNIKHLKATALGKMVTCTSTLQEVNGNRLLFHIEANDDQGLIGEGYHERYIIDNNRFLEKLER